MTIYKRPDNTIFAESAQSGEVVAFENMPRGWGVTLDNTKGIPPMEWFNFLQNRTDKAIQYILQNGITEYDTNLEYPQNAVVKSGGKLYLCLRQNTNKPLSNGAYWELLIKNATTSQSGIVQLSNAIDSTDETKASTSLAVKKANDNANQRLSVNGGIIRGAFSVINPNDYSNIALINRNKEKLNIEISPTSNSYIVLRNREDKNVGYFEFKKGQHGYVVTSDSSLVVPAGVIIPYAGENIPAGWLRMDNGYYDPKVYPRLFAVLGYYYGRRDGKFLVPSIENRFIRGMANGLTRGQKQEDAIRNIVGRVGPIDAEANCTGAFEKDGRAGYGATTSNSRPIIKFDASRVVPTADENRPKSIAFPYIIKH